MTEIAHAYDTAIQERAKVVLGRSDTSGAQAQQTASGVAPQPPAATTVPTLGHRHRPDVAVDETFQNGIRWVTYRCECGATLPPRAG